MYSSTLLTLLTLTLGARNVLAESHTITFANKCGFGTPQLLIAGKVVSTGQPYTVNGGQIPSAIAYLQTKNGSSAGCDFNGERCTLIEMNLVNANPGIPGSGSSTDISLIPTHAFNVPAGFQYYGADGTCDGLGAFCNSPGCNTAFFKPDDTTVQRACQLDNINLHITFCGGQQTSFTSAVKGSLASLGNGGSAAPPPPPPPPPKPASTSSDKPAAPTSPASAPAKPTAPVNVGSNPSSPAAAPSSSPSSSSASSSTPAPITSPSQCRVRKQRRAAEVEREHERAVKAHAQMRRRWTGRL